MTGIAWGLVLALHILCAVVWVGGMFFALAVFHPATLAVEPAARIALMGRVLKRFFLVVWHAMPLILISGYAMLFGQYGGFAGVDWPIHAMHGLGLIMAALFVVLVVGPWKRFRSAVQPSTAITAGGAIRRLVSINLVLGVVTVILAAWGQ
jgi:uncharacterized membrane protein